MSFTFITRQPHKHPWVHRQPPTHPHPLTSSAHITCVSQYSGKRARIAHTNYWFCHRTHTYVHTHERTHAPWTHVHRPHAQYLLLYHLPVGGLCTWDCRHNVLCFITCPSDVHTHTLTCAHPQTPNANPRTHSTCTCTCPCSVLVHGRMRDTPIEKGEKIMFLPRK